MLVSVGIMIIVYNLITSVVDGQCVDCNKHWEFHCQTNHTGYFCEPGANIRKKFLTQEQYETSTPNEMDIFDTCTPYPFYLEHAKTFCCLFSPSLGCQVAVNPNLYHYVANPASFCDQCEEYCQCDDRSGSLGLKSCLKDIIMIELIPQLIFSLIVNSVA